MKTFFLPLLAVAAIGFTSCNQTNEVANDPAEATADTAVVYRDGRTVGDVAEGAADATGDAFDLSKAKLADATLPEIKTKGTTVRGDADYQVYSVDEVVLFDTDKAAIKPSAANALNEVLGSINQRYSGKDVRVMGFADSRGAASYNLDLAKQRAEAVKNYLTQNGKLAADKVSTESFGQEQPVATNATPEGRQKNRRVEIVVRTR
ncbi:OmpA family protein [Hymenobacter sp. B1770]|uniref:OmpA family protein n=1 Tax=Hymenobacter sp. B1770 TaxID=1718788 RepID=UPI003CF3623E